MLARSASSGSSLILFPPFFGYDVLRYTALYHNSNNQ